MKNILTILILMLPFFVFSQQSKIKECYQDSLNGIQFCIAADSITYDKHFGDSYRLLLIKDSEDKIIEKIYLKINRSPDFPYSIISEFYSKYKLLIIKGCAMFYLLDPITLEISDQIFPNYTNCEFSDGQGSYIRNIEIIENGTILQLDVIECGTHKFDIRDIEHIIELN